MATIQKRDRCSECSNCELRVNCSMSKCSKCKTCGKQKRTNDKGKITECSLINKNVCTYKIIVAYGLDVSGKQLRKTTSFTPETGLTEKQEQKALADFVHDFEKSVKGGQHLDSSVKFATFAEQWFTNYAEPHLAPKTVYRYRGLIPRINSYIGNMRLDKIQPLHIIAMNNALAEPGQNMNTGKGLWKELTALYKQRKKNDPVTSASPECLAVIKAVGGWGYIVKELDTDRTEKLREKFLKAAGGKLSPKTIQHHYRLVSVILKFAVEWQTILSNPCDRVKTPTVPDTEAEVLDEEQAKEVMELLNEEPLKFKVAYILAIFSGFRRGEITGLKWPDIDYKNNIISINRTTQYLPGRGIFEKVAKNKKSHRTIKLPPEVFALLKEYQIWQLEERFRIGSAWHDNGYLFTTWNGLPMHPDTLTGEFKQFAIKNNLPEGIHLHSLRHTNGTLQIAAGVNVRTVSARLGHAQTSTTMNIYAHAIQSADAAASEVLADILNPTKKDIKKLG